jgi:hypothetical protein
VARIAVEAVREHPKPGIEVVRFVLFSDRLHRAFTAALG